MCNETTLKIRQMGGQRCPPTQVPRSSKFGRLTKSFHVPSPHNSLQSWEMYRGTGSYAVGGLKIYPPDLKDKLRA